MKRVLLFGQMAAANCFIRLATLLEQRGLTTDVVVGGGKPIVLPREEIRARVQTADLVLLAMSSPENQATTEIMAAEEARAANIPYGFYGDMREAWKRARANGGWLNDLAGQAAFYFGVTPEDTEAAREVFPLARLIFTGNPLRDDEGAFPEFNRAQVRAKLGIHQDERLILLTTLKLPATNMFQVVLTIEALSNLASLRRMKFCLVLSPHPGDPTPLLQYEHLLTFCRQDPRLQIVTKETLRGTEIVPGADLVIEYGDSSIGLAAAYQEIPVVSLACEVLLRRTAKMTGGVQFDLVDTGSAKLVMANAVQLASTISRLLELEDSALMRARQRAAYPRPTQKGAALGRMAEAVTQLLA